MQDLEYNVSDMKNLLTLFAVITLAVSTARAQCVIHGVEIYQGYCNNYPHHYTHNVSIYGEAENVGSQGWEFFTPNFASGPLPYILHPISNHANFNYILPLEEEDCGDAFLITIRDVEFPDCSIEYFYEPRHCCCDIKNILVDTICTGPGQYRLRVDLEITGGDPANPNFDLILQTGQGFELFSGNFPLADLPVTIGPFEADGQSLVVIAEKTGVLDYCIRQREVQPMFCSVPECALTHIQTDKFPCEPSDQTYYTTLDFVIDNPGSLGFSLYDDHCQCSFEYQYSDLPLVLGPYPGDCQTDVHYTITDLEYGCEATHLMVAACCNPSNQCAMADIFLDTLCTDSDAFLLLVDFSVVNGGAGGFSLFLNGASMGTFAYADLPVELGSLPADCQTAYLVRVEDVLDPTCQVEGLIQAACCFPTCSISDLQLTPSCLSEDSMALYIDFEIANGSSDGFELWLNDSLIAILNYSALPYAMDPLYTDCVTSYIISVVDRQDPHCSIDALLDEACCAMMIPQFSVWEIDTICHDGSSFELTMHFEVSQPGSMGWKVQVNGTEVGPFAYDASFPVLGPFDIDCEGPVSVTLYDVQHPAGREAQEIADLCCLNSNTETSFTARVHYRMLPNGLLVLENELPMPVAWSLHNILGQPIVGRRPLEAGARLDFQLSSAVAGMVILHIDAPEGHQSILLLIH
jgi:hypothetical protein